MSQLTWESVLKITLLFLITLTAVVIVGAFLTLTLTLMKTVVYMVVHLVLA